MIMSSLALGLADALASAAQPKPKRLGLVQRLIQVREDQAKRRVLGYLTPMDDQRLTSLGFTAEDIEALRQGELRLPK
jgi:hypothetical protein